MIKAQFPEYHGVQCCVWPIQRGIERIGKAIRIGGNFMNDALVYQWASEALIDDEGPIRPPL
jgi:hypothetical protein